MKISEIKELLQTGNIAPDYLKELTKDPRKGVQSLLKQYSAQKAQAEQAIARQQELLKYEKDYYAQGYELIAGIDEAGRGPLAGPLVVASVILPPDCHLLGVDDSKKLSAAKRETLYCEILQQALAVDVEIITTEEIDELNIYQATLLGMNKCIDNMPLKPQVVLLDAMPLEREGLVTMSIVKGDSLSLSIAAASIVAKVTRDKIMSNLHLKYPMYGFDKHKGYGTAEHIEAIDKHGITKCHRRSFEPIKSKYLNTINDLDFIEKAQA